MRAAVMRTQGRLPAWRTATSTSTSQNSATTAAVGMLAAAEAVTLVRPAHWGYAVCLCYALCADSSRAHGELVMRQGACCGHAGSGEEVDLDLDEYMQIAASGDEEDDDDLAAESGADEGTGGNGAVA
jgi:hypothetical protein